MINNTCNTLALFTLLFVGLGSVIPLSQNVSTASEPFVDFYKSNCIPEAQASGLTKRESQKLCDCTVNTIKYKYKVNEFQTLLSRYRDGNRKAKEILTSYGTACFDEVLEDLLFED